MSPSGAEFDPPVKSQINEIDPSAVHELSATASLIDVPRDR